MPICKLIECSDNCSKSSGKLHHNCKDEPASDNNNAIADFVDDDSIDSFNPNKAGLIEGSFSCGGRSI